MKTINRRFSRLAAYFRRGFVALFAVANWLSASQASAQTTGHQAPTTNRYGFVDPLGNRSLPQIAGAIIRFSLGFVGALFLLYFIYGGFVWLTAGGSDQKVQIAKDSIKNAVIGIVIVMLSYTLVGLLLNYTSLFVGGS